MTCNFIKRRLQHMCFSVNIARFLKSPMLKNICERRNDARLFFIKLKKIYNLPITSLVFGRKLKRHFAKLVLFQFPISYSNLRKFLKANFQRERAHT